MVREVVKRGLLISNNDIENPAGGDGDVLVLKVDQGLTEAFRWEKVGRPAGLGTVIVRGISSSSSLRLIRLFIPLTLKNDRMTWFKTTRYTPYRNFSPRRYRYTNLRRS